MKILVVCAAGASSTFVAQRLRTAAQGAGLDWDATAAADTAAVVDSVDVVLLGPHLADRVAELSARGVTVVALPPDIFRDLTGERTLGLVRTTLGLNAPAKGTP